MNFLDRIAGEWRERATQLAEWTMSHLVNRTDVWGRYLAENQRKPKADGSRNNAIVGLLAAGEGWHNNHHADPGSARHGHKWWEFDLTWQVIRLLAQLGLATKVVLPAPGLAGRGLVKPVVDVPAAIPVDQR